VISTLAGLYFLVGLLFSRGRMEAAEPRFESRAQVRAEGELNCFSRNVEKRILDVGCGLGRHA